MKSVHTLQLALAAEDVLRQWGMGEDNCVVACGSLGFLEHCIHEMAHACSLGIPFNEEAPSRIGVCLYPDEDFAVAEEARAWAIGWHVWQKLELSSLTWDDLCCGAEIQGVESYDVKKLISAPHIQVLAAHVVVQLQELSDNHRKDMEDSYAVTNNRWGHVTSGKGPYNVFRYTDEADKCLKDMSDHELMKLASLHLQDIDGDEQIVKELMRRGTQT